LVMEWKLPSELNDVLAVSPAEATDRDLAMLIRAATAEATRLGLGVLESEQSDPLDPALLEISQRVNQIEQDLGI
jgi:hypothetical protein